MHGSWEEWVARTGDEPHAEDMSDKPPRREVMYGDLERLPSHVVGEIVGGELYVSPRPRVVHARAAFRLGRALGSFDDDEPVEGALAGWVLLFEPELHLGGEVLVPDIAGWRRERMPELPDTPAVTLAPDWVCEVLSASTEGLDRTRKMGSYLRESVGHLWLVDPRSQVLEVYRRENGRWSRLGAYVGAVTLHAEPFEALALRLGTLWRR